MTSSTSVRSYQSSSVAIVAYCAMSLPVRAHRLRHHLVGRPPGAKPCSRATRCRLAVSRLTSHSQGAGQRLVEVVDREGEVAFGRREVAEVADVGVAARLDAQPGRRCRREVERHHRGRAAQEPERRLGHPSVANRHEVGQATRRLVLEHVDRIASVTRARSSRRAKISGRSCAARDRRRVAPPKNLPSAISSKRRVARAQQHDVVIGDPGNPRQRDPHSRARRRGRRA